MSLPSFAQRAALAGFGLLLGALLLELALRFLPTRAEPEDDRPAYLVGPPRMSPFRERPEIPAKLPGVFRIVALGDSFTWGANVQMNYTYPKLLESLLNGMGAGEYEVYNFGMNGAGTVDELDLLQKLAVHQPDLFLLGYFLNDPSADPEASAGPEDAPSWLRLHSSLVDFVQRRLSARRLKAREIGYYRSLYDPGGSKWKNHRETVGRLARTAERLGVPVHVVIWPHLAFPMDERYPFRDIHRQVGGLFAEAHLPALDLLEVFWKRDNDRLQAVPAYDPHPSEIAHRLAAEAVFARLRETYPVPTGRVRKTEATALVRLLFLGDFVDGVGTVLLAQSYPRHVEWLIRTVCRGEARIDAVRTEDPLAELRRRLPDSPDVVVVEQGAMNLDELAAIQQESRLRVLVLRWPKLDSPLDESPEKVGGASIVDLIDVFRGKDRRRLQSLPGQDPRPSEIAHRLAGEAVFDWLRAHEPRLATGVVGPRIHPNTPHWQRWRRLGPGR